MNSDRGAVRQFLTAIAARLVAYKGREWSAQEASNALWGLQGMRCDYPEVRRVLSALLPSVEGVDEVL